MKLEEFVSFPARISDDFIGVPTISEVFGHYIVIQRELSSRSVKWSKEDVYNQVAKDPLSVCLKLADKKQFHPAVSLSKFLSVE